MAPKKDKKKEEENNKAAAFTEVEKEFLVLQIADLNRKVARLRTAVDEYEVRNEELQKAYDQLDEDRADIIAYLKKTLNVKTEENLELKDKVRGLEETREIETDQFKETVAELEKNFITMKDHLTSENKLLAGKLNTLEEFRAVRDDLMRKFEIQEQEFKDQEEKYNKIIYEAEKKFTTDKDKLKKEMEARLLQLAQDFQDATELRIAASTHRVIRENIAINNELDTMLSTQTKLSQLNEKYKDSERVARVALELAEQERDKVINKNIIQLKVIDQLTTAFQDAKKKSALYEQANFDFETQQAKIQKLTKENEDILSQVHILEENLQTRISEQNKCFVEANKVSEENNKFKKILQDAAIAVRAALKLDRKVTTDAELEIMDRQSLLSSLLDIVTQYREIKRAEPTDTLDSIDRIYKEGDLGFIPKAHGKRASKSAVSMKSLRQTEKSSSSLHTAISTSSLGSVKTVLDQEVSVRDSLCLAISAKSSDISSSKGEEEGSTVDMTDVAKQLTASTAEIHSSEMKGEPSKMDLELEKKHTITKSKSVKIMEITQGECKEGKDKSEDGGRKEEEKKEEEEHIDKDEKDDVDVDKCKDVVKQEKKSIKEKEEQEKTQEIETTEVKQEQQVETSKPKKENA